MIYKVTSQETISTLLLIIPYLELLLHSLLRLVVHIVYGLYVLRAASPLSENEGANSLSSPDLSCTAVPVVNRYSGKV